MHTPGPLAVIESASGKPLIIERGATGERDLARMFGDSPDAWATAGLFAAAPELLAAAQQALAWFDDQEPANCRATRAALQTAIAKVQA